MNTLDHTSGHYLDLGDAKIYYELSGDESSPVLLVLHGGFGTLEDLNSVLAGLETSFRVMGIDSRGQGKSTLGSQVLTYERMQKDVEEVLRHLGVATLSILGFSDGGIVAYRLAALNSLNVEKLVTIGAAWDLKDDDPAREIFARVTGKSWRERFPETVATYERLNPEADFDRLARAVVEMWLDSSSSGYPDETVRTITCPLLIVRGDDDHLVSRDNVFALASRVETARLLNVPFAGHVAYEDQAAVFMGILNTFLSR